LHVGAVLGDVQVVPDEEVGAVWGCRAGEPTGEQVVPVEVWVLGLEPVDQFADFGAGSIWLRRPGR
jgi:hypothetical protein